MKGSTPIPEGFEIDFMEGYKPGDDGIISQTMQIPKERARALQRASEKALAKFIKHRGDFADIPQILAEVAPQCKSASELALCCFGIGITLEGIRNHNSGGGPNIRVAIVRGGIIPPSEEDGEEGGDDIDSLIRKSYKINGKPGKEEEED